MREPQGAVVLRLLVELCFKIQRRELPPGFPARQHLLPYLTIFAFVALLVEFLAQPLFVQTPWSNVPLEVGSARVQRQPFLSCFGADCRLPATDCTQGNSMLIAGLGCNYTGDNSVLGGLLNGRPLPRIDLTWSSLRRLLPLPAVRRSTSFPQHDHPCSGRFAASSTAKTSTFYEQVALADRGNLYGASRVDTGGPCIPASNGQRYFVTNYYRFTIDVSHFESGMQRGREILKDLDAGRALTAVRDQIRSLPGAGAFGYTSVYIVVRHPTTRAERESIAWGIYLHSQRLFERWQGSGWLSLGNEWLHGSSYATEDLPSDYLGFFAAARYPYLSSETALKMIALQLGGGVWSDTEPPHARFLGYRYKRAARGTVAIPLSWGDLRLKNHFATPRVEGANGWYNVAWPASLSISPIGQDTHWRYRWSFNTRNGQPWSWY